MKYCKEDSEQIQFLNIDLKCDILPEDAGGEDSVGRKVIRKNFVVAHKVLSGLLKLNSSYDASWQPGNGKKEEVIIKKIQDIFLEKMLCSSSVFVLDEFLRYLMKTPCSPTDFT